MGDSGTINVAQAAEFNGDANVVAEGINQIASVLHEGLIGRVDNLYQVHDNWTALLGAIQADGRSVATVVLISLVSLAGGIAVLMLARELVARRGAGLGGLLRTICAIFLSAVVVVITSRIVTGDEPTRRLIILWSGTAIVGLTGRQILIAILSAGWAPLVERRGLRAFSEIISATFIWGVVGISAISTLRGLRANLGLLDIVSSFLVSLPVAVLPIFAYLRFRQPVLVAVAGPPPCSARRLHFAAVWPFLAAAGALATFLTMQISITVGRPLPGLPLLLTLLLLLLTPHIDSTLAERARMREQTASDSLPWAALSRTKRFAFSLLALIAIGYQWAFPALVALGIHSGESEWRSVSLALVALTAAWAWNVVGIGVERLSSTDHEQHVDNGAPRPPRSRLETLFPLIGGTARFIILLIATLTVMLLLGVNVWPIITGLSVFGLAVSFGSQTLVKDIVSGLFFLLDDAFRMGEYVETSGAKGTVERISIRSVRLRHPRGPFATIPYGQIGKIENFSRDWVIEKLLFRVAFDTDVEKVRKLFKQIGVKLAEDPAFANDLLETFKSQGIAAVEDGTLLVRGKFKSRAGKQFVIRKKVYLEVQQAFRENGIAAVSKPMIMARLPSAEPAAAVVPSEVVAANTAPRQQTDTLPVASLSGA